MKTTKTQRIEVGRFVIEKLGRAAGEGMVWIADTQGSALLVDQADLAGVIEKYFFEQFETKTRLCRAGARTSHNQRKTQ